MSPEQPGEMTLPGTNQRPSSSSSAPKQDSRIGPPQFPRLACKEGSLSQSEHFHCLGEYSSVNHAAAQISLFPRALGC